MGVNLKERMYAANTQFEIFFPYYTLLGFVVALYTQRLMACTIIYVDHL